MDDVYLSRFVFPWGRECKLNLCLPSGEGLQNKGLFATGTKRGKVRLKLVINDPDLICINCYFPHIASCAIAFDFYFNRLTCTSDNMPLI